MSSHMGVGCILMRFSLQPTTWHLVQLCIINLTVLTDMNTKAEWERKVRSLLGHDDKKWKTELNYFIYLEPSSKWHVLNFSFHKIFTKKIVFLFLICFILVDCSCNNGFLSSVFNQWLRQAVQFLFRKSSWKNPQPVLSLILFKTVTDLFKIFIFQSAL